MGKPVQTGFRGSLPRATANRRHTSPLMTAHVGQSSFVIAADSCLLELVATTVWWKPFPTRSPLSETVVFTMWWKPFPARSLVAGNSGNCDRSPAGCAHHSVVETISHSLARCREQWKLWPVAGTNVGTTLWWETLQHPQPRRWGPVLLGMASSQCGGTVSYSVAVVGNSRVITTVVETLLPGMLPVTRSQRGWGQLFARYGFLTVWWKPFPTRSPSWETVALSPPWWKPSYPVCCPSPAANEVGATVCSVWLPTVWWKPFQLGSSFAATMETVPAAECWNLFLLARFGAGNATVWAQGVDLSLNREFMVRLNWEFCECLSGWHFGNLSGCV